jgi:hypothetical protein
MGFPNTPTYDWTASMGNYGQAASGFGSGLGSQPFGSNWNPQQAMTAQMPTGVGALSAMPTSMDLSAMSAGAQPMGGSVDWNSAMTARDGTMAQYGGGMPAGGGGIKGWCSNGQNLGALAQGFGALTSAWLGYQNLRVAKDQLGFQKDAFNKNYKSQTQSYNTSLEDRIRGRTADYSGKEQDVQAYLDKNKLGG